MALSGRVIYYSYTILDSPPGPPEGPVKLEIFDGHYSLSWKPPRDAKNDVEYLVEIEYEPNLWMIVGKFQKKKYLTNVLCIRLYPKIICTGRTKNPTISLLCYGPDTCKDPKFKIFAHNRFGISQPLTEENVKWPFDLEIEKVFEAPNVTIEELFSDPEEGVISQFDDWRVIPIKVEEHNEKPKPYFKNVKFTESLIDIDYYFYKIWLKLTFSRK